MPQIGVMLGGVHSLAALAQLGERQAEDLKDWGKLVVHVWDMPEVFFHLHSCCRTTHQNLYLEKALVSLAGSDVFHLL